MRHLHLPSTTAQTLLSIVLTDMEKNIWSVLLPVSDRLTESKGLLMTSARSVCENNLPFSIRIKLSPTPILSPKICN